MESSNVVTIPRVIAVVVLATLSFVVYVGKHEQSKIIHREEQLNEKYSSRVMPVTTDSFAPIFMQQAATGEHAIKLLMKKYGLTGNKATKYKEPMITKNKGDKDASNSWLFATISGSSPESNVGACEGNEYFNCGIILNTCIDTLGSGQILTCNDGEISAYWYSDNSCSGSPSSSAVVGTEGCFTDPPSTPWGPLTTDDENSRSVSVSCVSAGIDGPAVGESPNHYAVLKAYTESSCSTDSYEYFESYNGDVCIPLTIQIEGDTQEEASCMFKDGEYSNFKTDSAAPYMKMYGNTRKCQGAETKKMLSTSCVSGSQWSYVDYETYDVSKNDQRIGSDKGVPTTKPQKLPLPLLIHLSELPTMEGLDLEIFPTEKLEKELAESKRAVKELRLQVKGLNILLAQNAALEQEVTRLCKELDEATKGVLKRGFLYKWRDREISYAAKWGLRYFVLQGKTLSYFVDEHDNRPRRTIDLSHCIVRSDGTKKGGTYHVFCVYLASENLQTAESLLLRLSTESKAEAVQWIDTLEQACVIADLDHHDEGNTWKDKISPANMNMQQLVVNALGPFPNATKQGPKVVDADGKELMVNVTNSDEPFDNNEDWGHTPIDVSITESPLNDVGDGLGSIPRDDMSAPDNDLNGMSPKMIHRVRSTNLILKKSQSRSMMARQILHKRAPTVFSSSGANLLDREAAAKASETNGNNSTTVKSMIRVKSFPAFKPMHRESKSSPLSYDRGPGEQNFRGFFNLGVIILFLSHFRMAIENFDKHGFLPHVFKDSSTTAAAKMAKNSIAKIAARRLAEKSGIGLESYLAMRPWDPPRILEAVLSWALTILIAYISESLAAKNRLSERTMLIINLTTGTLNLLVPMIWIWRSNVHPTGGIIYMLQSVILWMKLISYAHANRDLRTQMRNQKKATEKLMASMPSTASFGSKIGLSLSNDADMSVNGKPVVTNIFAEAKDLEPPFLSYPMNITLSNLMYFCLAPTLTYQLNFPRLSKIRWKHLASILVRIVAVVAMIMFFFEQYMKPTLTTSVVPMRDLDIKGIMERLLKLSIPNTYVWLLGFYMFFHLWLNMLAEITRFGDRLFYRDWWNARTIESYWRNWNLPVHHWMLRHLYYPLTRAGVSKSISTFLVFAVSAALHEVIISTPFHIMSGHAFFGMLAQVPLIFLTKQIDKTFDNAFMGNAIFWSAFCLVGQPMGIVMYYYDVWKLSQGTGTAT